jgi:sigma-B regulation protein RsbU (phosphoserine phosphatase)
VSGKGVGAAMYMAVCRTLLRAKARDVRDPGLCLAAVNETLATEADDTMFVTVCYAVLDTQTGDIVYAKGGHPPPYIVGPSGVRELAPAEGTVVGMLQNQTFTSARDRLSPGEFVVMYSDGVTEATNMADDFFTSETLERVLAAAPRTSCRALADAVLDAVSAFQGAARQADDITVVTVGLTPRT